MYSDSFAARALTALLPAHGVRRAVVCAGSRNAPLAHCLASSPDIETWPAVDERSGAFQALGLAQASGEPAAVCVTSGSALLDAAPALAEAFYQEIPLVLVSADRPSAWIDQRDGQTMRQTGALAHVTRRSVQLPEGDGAEARWQLNRLLNEALLAALGPVPGPVHINVPLAEPLFGFSEPGLPEVRVIRRTFARRFSLPPDAVGEWRASRRVLILAGQLPPDHGLSPLLKILMSRGVVAGAEHLGNLGDLCLEDDPGRRPADCLDLLSALPEKRLRALAPDLVITLGGHLFSKRLKFFLRKVPGLRHWHVSADGSLPDLFQKLTRGLAGTARAVLEALAEAPAPASDPGFARAWREEGARARKKIAAEPLSGWSDPSVFKAFLAALPPDCALHIGNSSPLRNAQFFSLPRGTRVYANRGINGIDGTLSAALGNAQADARPLFCCLGDLSFFYDQNALWRETLPANLRVLLFNNGGGAIFRTLPGLDSPHTARFIAGTNAWTAEQTAARAGLRHLRAASSAELAGVLPRFISEPGPSLLEVRTEARAGAEAQARLLKAVTG